MWTMTTVVSSRVRRPESTLGSMRSDLEDGMTIVHLTPARTPVEP
jgi:hypothetical protein